MLGFIVTGNLIEAKNVGSLKSVQVIPMRLNTPGDSRWCYACSDAGSPDGVLFGSEVREEDAFRACS
jgi:hypothetical protein